MVYALRMPFARAARENLRHFDGEEPGVQTNYLCTKQEQGGGLVLLKALVQLHGLERPRTLLCCSCTSIRLDLPPFPPERVVPDREGGILAVLMAMPSRLGCVPPSFLTRKASSQVPPEYPIYRLGLFCLLIQSCLASDLFLISADRRFLSSGHNS
jgi:hypothetical protein